MTEGGGHGKLAGLRISSGVLVSSPKHCGILPLACNMSHHPSERSRSPTHRSNSDGDGSGVGSSSGASSGSSVPLDSGGDGSGVGSSSGASGVQHVVYVDEPSGDEACSKCMALAQRVKELRAEVRSLQQKLEKSEEGLRHTEKTLADVMESFVPGRNPESLTPPNTPGVPPRGSLTPPITPEF